MKTTEMTYCRLCAEKKPLNKLKNFQSDTEMWQKIIDKLSRLNLFLDLHENILPKTVCLLCSRSLESAFSFVTTVEHAQATLSDLIVVEIKKEENDSDDVNIFNELPDESRESIDEIVTIKKSYMKGEHSNKNISIEECNDDSEDAKMYKPPDDEELIVDSKEKVANIIEVKLDIEEYNNVNFKHQIPVDTFCEVKNDKMANAQLNMNPEVFDLNKVDTDKLTSSPKVINANTENSDFIDKQINRLAKIPLDALKKTWIDFNWKCSYCETIFPNVDELQLHSMQYHNACNTYKCADCNSRKMNLNGFIKHVREHRKYLHYSCYRCFMKFTNPQEGCRHKKTHHTSDYICMGCHTNFPSKDELETHVTAFFKNMGMKKSISHTNRKRDHFCEICGKGFFNNTYLTNHMIVHSDTKPYQCEICKHEFRNIYLLRYHSRVHSGEKPFMCDQCDQCFREKKQLRSHIRIHSNSLPYSCTQCDKKFRAKTYLKNHMRQHTGEKPYSCEICERNFTGWSNYNKHMKRKHGTDKSKRKRTPLGPHAVDPTTGDVVYPAMDKVLEWRKKMKEPLNQKRRGRQPELKLFKKYD